MCASPGVGASPGGFGEWGHIQVALESGGITRWLWRVGASTGGFGECGHHQRLWRVGASPGGSGVWGASPGGFGEWGHLQVALESEGITMGFGE